jgi:hypothetical protein
MKKIVCLAFVLFTNIGAFAQEKVNQRAEFEKIYDASFRLFATKAHRKINTDSNETHLRTQHSNKSSKPYRVIKSTSKRTIEVLPGVGSHSINEANLSTGNKKTEQITIGGKQYTREGDGRWKVEAVKVAAKAKNTSKSEITINRFDKYTECTFPGNEKLGNQNTKVYLITVKNRPVKSEYSNEVVFNKTIKYWFGKDGMLLKTESKGEWSEAGKPPVLITHNIQVNELDPKIRIKAPEIENKVPKTKIKAAK